MAKKNGKINKKPLIELFESQLTLDNVKTQEYYKSNLTKEGGYGWIKFQTIEQIQRTNYYTSEDYCYMRLMDFEGKFYLEFNSLFDEITMTEFLRLRKLLFKKETSVIINTKVTKSTKDLDLLNKALSEKIETETRKTIIEKAPK